MGGIRKNLERKSMDGLDPDLLDFIRLEEPKVRWPKGLVQKTISTIEPNRKRLALQDLQGEPKKCVLLDEESMMDSVDLNLECFTLNSSITGEQKEIAEADS